MRFSIRILLCVAVVGAGCGDMATDLTLRAAGLYTDPNPHSDAPPGALRVADNVVIRRAGVLEPRPGFRAEETGGGAAYVGIYPSPTGDGSAYYLQKVAGLDDDSGSSVTMGGEYASSEITQSGEYAGAHSARLYNELYIPAWDAGGVARVSNGAARRAGLPRLSSPELTVGAESRGNWLLDDEAVSYRVVLADYVGTRLVVGAPSGYVYVRNTTGVTASVSVRVSFDGSPNVQAGWTIQVYRSPTVAVSIIPNDELALAMEYEVTSTDVTNGFVDILDQSTVLGASLYTNATQQGALQENGRPPACQVLEAYADMMFYGNVREPQRLTLTWSRDPTSGFQNGGIADFVLGDATVTRTSGGFPSQDYEADLYIVNNGQYVRSLVGTTVADYSWIDTLGSVFEMSQGAKATASAQWDSVYWAWFYRDAGVTPSAYDESYWYEPDETQVVNLATGELRSNGQGMNQFAWSLARRATVVASVLDGQQDEQHSILLERDSYAADLGPQDPFSVRLPRSSQRYISASTSVFNTSGGTGDEAPAIEYFSEATERVNRVFYSKKQEPEHVPPVNFVDIGASSEPIIAMKSTRRALFVFKTDGVWVITGDTPETLRVDQIDSTARLLHPKAVAVGGDRVFAWTDAGVVMIGEGGVEANLSAPAIEPDLRAIQVSLQSTADPSLGSTHGCFLSYQDGEERLLLGVPAAIGDDAVDSVYQYDMRTQGWTRWTWATYEVSHAAGIGGRIHLAGEDDAAEGEVWIETLASDEAPHADITQTLSPGALTIVTQTTAEVVVIGSFVIPVGAWVYQGSPGTEFRGVVSAYQGGSPATMTITKISGTLLAGGEAIFDVEVYEPVEQCIEWVAKTAQTPTVTKHWQRGVLTYESDRRMYEATLSFRSDMIHVPASVTTQHTLHDDALPEDVPFIATRAHARSAILLPKLCISQGGARWSISALHLDYELGSSRAGRRAR